MLIDEAQIQVKAGHGGKGGVYFQRIRMALGPTGADGGRGGDVYFEGVSDIGALSQFRFSKKISAEDGENGKAQNNDGADGRDMIVKIPVGTVIFNTERHLAHEVIKIGERVRVAKGGLGGKGNYKFRSSTNTSPKQSQGGLPGEEFTLRLELKLIADVGLVGLPNVGKSSLLNTLTNAKSKVANYQFTTLEPYLGVYYDLILADIPGIIEGASQGKGLGTKFLRHIERTHTIFHLVAADSPDPLRDYKTIRAELATYSNELAEKKEYILISRADEVAPDELKKVVALFKKQGITALPISVLETESLAPVKKILDTIAREKVAKN